jgi:Tfp pilus assembly protein PilF
MTILLYNMGLRAKQAGDFGRASEIWTRALALSEPVGLPMAALIRRMLADLSD